MDKYKILKGLPGEGHILKQFSYGSKNTYSEGFIIQFFPSNGKSWVGNFQSGMSSFSQVLCHFYREEVVTVISKGQIYIVDINKKEQIKTFSTATRFTFTIPDRNLLILVEFNALIAINGVDVLWRYKIENCDGIRDLNVSHNMLTGEWCRVPDDVWEIFHIDIDTGKSNL